MYKTWNENHNHDNYLRISLCYYCQRILEESVGDDMKTKMCSECANIDSKISGLETNKEE